jgi:zinc protease
MRNVFQTRKIKICVIIFFAVFVPATASFAAGPLGKRIVLDNGMVLLLSEKHEIPMVTVNMAISAGSTAEPADKPGLASITAALLTQGTTRRTAGQIQREIDFIGGSLSVSGGSDFASARMRVLKKDVRTGLDLLSDVLLDPVFDQKEIDRQVKETLAEIRRQKEDPGVVAAQAFAKAVYGGHPYGRTNEEEAAYLPKLTRADVRAFYSERYAPDDAVIAVVGDVTEQEITGLLNEYFKAWKKKARPLPASVAPPVIGKTEVIKIDKSVAQANIDMGNLGISREDPDFYAVTVMNFILGGGGFSSRLMDTIRDNEGLAYDVHSWFSARKEPGAFTVSIQTKNESANEVIAETIRQLRRMQSGLVSEKELADAKAYLTGSFPLKMDTSAKIAGMLVATELYGLGLDYPRKYPGLINKVTREQVREAARKYLRPDKMAIVVVADQNKAKLKY